MMGASFTSIMIFTYYYITEAISYYTLNFLLCLPSDLLKPFMSELCILEKSKLVDDDSESSDTEIVNKNKDDTETEEFVYKVLQKNSIDSIQFSQRFVSEYIQIFFRAYSSLYKEYKTIEFLKVEILDLYGFVIDITVKIRFFIKDDYIHTQKLLQYYPNAKFIFMIYKDYELNKMKKKAVHLQSKRELLTDNKYSFGKIIL